MNEQQLRAIRLAERLSHGMSDTATREQASEMLRTQHAAIERLNAAATDSNLILERAQATNLEMLAAIERKDALLRQALDMLRSADAGFAVHPSIFSAIKQELSQ